MSILSHEQRLFFYERLLKEVCRDPRTQFGFCYYVPWTLLDMGGNYKKAYDNHLMAKHLICIELPELYAIKPVKSVYDQHWYATTSQGWQTRINKLYKIIKTMKRRKKTHLLIN